MASAPAPEPDDGGRRLGAGLPRSARTAGCSAGHARTSFCLLVGLAAPALHGFRIATAGQRLFFFAARLKDSSLLVEVFVRGAVTLAPLTPGMLTRVHALLEQYADLPMDLADATLVALAEELGTDLVLTTDRRDFEVYRIKGKRRFRILPEG